MKTLSISAHWDTGAIITANSDPSEEFRIWHNFASGDPGWTGDEFTLSDFEDYIDALKTGFAP